MQQAKLIKSIQGFLSKATGTIVTPQQAAQVSRNADVLRLLSDPAAVAVLTDPKVSKNLTPTNAEQPLASVLVHHITTHWQHGGGKNAKHKNPRAKQSAKEKYEEAKAKYDALKSKPNKTPDDKDEMEKWRKQKERWRKKAEETGEHHSQRAKVSTSIRKSGTGTEENPMALFSFVVDCNGTTAVSQSKATSVDEAIANWTNEFDLRSLGLSGKAMKDAMVEEAQHEEATPVRGLEGVWCFCLPIGDHFAVVHVVGT